MPSVTVLKEGIVVNVVELHDGAAWQPPADCIIGPSGGDIGQRWDGKQFIDLPPVEHPRRAAIRARIDKMRQKVADRRAKMTPQEKLEAAGLTLDDLKVLLTAAQEPVKLPSNPEVSSG